MNTQVILIQNSLLISSQMLDGNYIMIDIVFEEMIEKSKYIIFSMPSFEFEPEIN